MPDPTPPVTRSIERRIEGALLAARWLLFPLYAALLVAMVAIYVMVAREMVLLFLKAIDASESDVVLVALAIVMISAIHLLRAFMNDAGPERLMVLAAVHAVFVLSALALAFVDRIS